VTPLVVVGAGGFGREVLDVVDAINAAAGAGVWDVVGVVDDAPSDLNLARLERRGVAYQGTVDGLLAERWDGHYVIGIGSPRVRRALAERLDAAGLHAATLVHPTVTQGFDVEIGQGSVLCAGARLTTNIRLGRHVHLNPNVTVGHDTVLGNHVSMNPASSVSGDCLIEDGVLIGVAAVVLNGLRVGPNVVIGGSACVVRDVAPGQTVVGVPALPLLTSDAPRSTDATASVEGTR
jgi:sugar O-acyltransferase (sialic acid O-acetyltransferase NeuD family)